MAKVDIITEMVNEHTTEEILDWIEDVLRRGVTDIKESDADPAYLLGQTFVNLKELRDVVIALNFKLNFPKGEGPVATV